MFTGIIEEVGTIEDIHRGTGSAVLAIRCSAVLEGTRIGDSIAVDGVCLTVTGMTGRGYTADVMSETLRRSSLGALKKGSRVNLERAMPACGRFGGHIVAGHIDGTGIVKSVHRDEMAVWYCIGTDEKILRYIVEKGSIAIDGISLTVAGVGTEDFRVSIIPHTQACTALADRKVGDIVNLENDIIGKYVERLLKPAGGAGQQPGSRADGAAVELPYSRTGQGGGVTLEMLSENGFI